VLAAAALFSTGGPAIKATVLSSWQVAGFRSGIAALALAALMPSWRRFWSPRPFAVGVAYAITMVLFVTSNKLTTAANAIFLQSTAPMYLLVLGPLVLGERVRASDLAFAATLAFGLALFFVGTEPPIATAPDPLLGNVVAALSGLAWALTIVGLRWLGRDDAGTGRDCLGESVIAGNVLAFAFCVPFALPAAPRPTDVAVVAYLGLFQIGLAYLFLARGVRGVGALEASLLLLLEPVLNPLGAWLVHGERPGPWALAGCVVILVATLARALLRGRNLGQSTQTA
jgi:drug/metabolite transporter (DMT)-like permease